MEMSKTKVNGRWVMDRNDGHDNAEIQTDGRKKPKIREIQKPKIREVI